MEMKLQNKEMQVKLARLNANSKAYKEEVKNAIPITVKQCVEADKDTIFKTANKEWTRGKVAMAVMFGRETQSYRGERMSRIYDDLFQSIVGALYDSNAITEQYSKQVKALAKDTTLTPKEQMHKATVQAFFRVGETACRDCLKVYYGSRQKLAPNTKYTTEYPKSVLAKGYTEDNEPYTKYGYEGKTLVKLEDVDFLIDSDNYKGSTSLYEFVSFDSENTAYLDKGVNLINSLDTNTLLDEILTASVSYLKYDRDITVLKSFINGDIEKRDMAPKQRKRVIEARDKGALEVIAMLG